jgi:hypothetical protein
MPGKPYWSRNVKKKLNCMMSINILADGGLIMKFGFILRFRTQDNLISVCEQLKKKSRSFTLKKLFNPSDALHRFTLVIECNEQDMVEVLENYFLIFRSNDMDISLLHGHESEIDKLTPI